MLQLCGKSLEIITYLIILDRLKKSQENNEGLLYG